MILFRCFWCYQPHTECACENDPIADGWMHNTNYLTGQTRSQT